LDAGRLWGEAFAFGSTPVFRNCVIAGNCARHDSGVYCDWSGEPLFENCAVSSNWGTESVGGISGYWVTVHLRDCVVWGNEGRPVRSRVIEAICSDVEGGISGVGNIVLPSGLQDRGEWLILPPPGFPSVDAGDPALEDAVSDWHPPRPEGYVDGARSDMGAYGGPGNANRWPPSAGSGPWRW
jgi:hypothetical protein